MNLQVLGFFSGTIDQLHLKPGDVEENYQVGQKLKARILYDISPSTPPRFALSLADHVLSLTSKSVDNSPLSEAFTVGAFVDPVKVIRVESERGLIVEVIPGVQGFIHVRAMRPRNSVSSPVACRYLKSLTSMSQLCHRTLALGRSAPCTEHE